MAPPTETSTVTVPTHTIQTVFSIETFDYTKTRFERWVKRLQSAFHVFGVPADKKLAYLLHYMGPEAYDLLCDKLSPEDPDNKTYEELVATMKSHYNPEPLEIAENFRFLQRRQQEGETAQEYLTALQKMAIHCKFGDYLKKALRNQFVFGLRSEKIQSRLLEVKDLTIDKAVETAISMEVSARDAKQLHSTTPTQTYSVNTVNSKKKTHGPSGQQNASGSKPFNDRNNNNNNNNFTCLRCGSAQHRANGCNAANLFCDFCKIKGHNRKACLKARRANKTPVSAKQVDEADESDECEEVGEIEELWALDSEHREFREKFFTTLEVNGTSIKFETDSGAAVSVMNKKQFKEQFPKVEIQQTTLRLMSYCKNEIDIVGFAQVSVKYRERRTELNLYIVQPNREPLIGREWIRQLGIELRECAQVEPSETNQDVNKILQKYPSIFQTDIGKITGIQAKLHVRENARPVYAKARKVPFAIMEKVEQELSNLVSEGVLIQVKNSDWATPIVPVLKSTGRIRICGDFKITLNPALITDVHPLPTVDELFSKMSGGDRFTKLDLTQAYLQMEVHPEVRKYLTLNTHKGLYQSTRLMYGIASAPAIWQREMERLLIDIPGVSVFLDDIKITAPDNATHLSRLDTVLSRLAEHNIRVNLHKCEFMQEKIEYCGYIINKQGVGKAHSKIEAIQKARPPRNKSEVRAFIGFVNYYGRFFKNLSHVLYPLNTLLKDETPFAWDKDCEKAFKTVKEEMQSETTLAHFDTNLPLVLATDASSYAVGAVLSHTYEDHTERPIQFASQTLTTVQQKYAQIDKEAYAIIFGIKKFYQYVFGRTFTLVTDHEPLVKIFSPTAGLPVFSAARMQHYAIFLQAFDYKIKYRNTKDHANADTMSRLPVEKTRAQQFDEPDSLEIAQIETLPVTLKELAKETGNDPSLAKLIQGLVTGKIVKREHRFNVAIAEFSLQQGCVFRGQRVVIPTALRKKVLEELHAVHFGIVKMKALARSHCWWPNISAEIESLAKNCGKCNETRNEPPKAPIHPWEPATKPFERVHVDYAGPLKNTYFLILVDAYSRWPEVLTTKSISSGTTIALCRRIFATYGLPHILVSDNGRQFVSHEFQRFLKENGIFHKQSAPYHPATNGLAERGVQTLKQALRALEGDDIDREVCKFLLHYRSTPHTITTQSPAKLLFGREINTRLDLLKPKSKEEEGRRANRAENGREFAVGTRVETRNYTRDAKWEFGHIKQKLGNLIYVVELDDGRVWKRHLNQIREIGPNTPPKRDPGEPRDTRPEEIREEGSSGERMTAVPLDQAEGRPAAAIESKGNVDRNLTSGTSDIETKSQAEAEVAPENHRDENRTEPLTLRRSQRNRKEPERLEYK